MENLKNYGEHSSVLLDECIDYLLENKSFDDLQWIADLTFGAGGHTFELCAQSKNIKIVALDQDLDAIDNGTKRILEQNYQDRIFLCHNNFEEFPDVVNNQFNYILREQGGFQGILMDLGVSSHQFDKGERGFSFTNDGELDMRMNQNDDNILTAKEVINTFREADLADLIYKYGEERLSRQIARNIVDARKKKKITTTSELENIIFHSYPARMRKGKTHPATRTFQALRLFVNKELEVLEKTLLNAANLLRPGGRFAVISFHSLEDRIVKHEFRRFAKEVGGFKVLTKKPILPKNNEIKRNFRSRSAKLRVLECI